MTEPARFDCFVPGCDWFAIFPFAEIVHRSPLTPDDWRALYEAQTRLNEARHAEIERVLGAHMAEHGFDRDDIPMLRGLAP